MPNIIIPTLILSLHNIFTSIWIGGMLVMIISLLPSIRKEIKDGKLQGSLIDEVMLRQSKWVYAGIAVLLITGILMTRLSGQTSGFFDFSNQYASILSIKHVLMIVVTVIALVRSIVFKNAASSKDKSKKKLSMALLFINTILGTAILVLSSMITIIG